VGKVADKVDPEAQLIKRNHLAAAVFETLSHDIVQLLETPRDGMFVKLDIISMSISTNINRSRVLTGMARPG
jgi:hypothetical protein